MFSTMNEQTPLSTLSLAIMGLIAQEPGSGYDLRKVFSTTPMGHFSGSPGAIYPALKRLAKSGWVRGSMEKKGTLRPRLVYTLTKKGRDVLRRHLSRPVTRDDVIWRMDELMLRFVFTDALLGREKTLQFLEQFRSEVESYLSSLKQYLDEVRNDIPLYARLAMEHGIAGYEMNAKWAKRATKELQVHM